MDLKNIVNDIKDSLEGLLASKSKGIIGIDIGMNSIKLAEVLKTGETQYKINRYTQVPLPEGTVIEDEIHKEDELIQALQEGLKKLDSPYKVVCVGLSGPNTVIKRLQLAGGSNEEIEDQVMWESEQYLPFSIDDGVIDFSVIGMNQGGGVDVIIGAAKKTVVSHFKEIVEKAGVKVKIVDLNAAATINVFEAVEVDFLSTKNQTGLILDIGAQKTHFMIYKNGVMAFFKEINIGGLTITEEIQRQMGVNYVEAEILKIQGDGNGNIPEEIVDLINQVLDTLFTELKKTIDFWVSSTTDEVFAMCVLTGGTVLIPGLPEAIEELLEVEVKILNPFETMSYNQNNIEEEELDDIAHKGVCAIGLAMRSLDE